MIDMRPATTDRKTGDQESARPVQEPAREPTRKRIIGALRKKNHAKSHAHWADHKAERGDRIGALAAHHDAKTMSDQANEDLCRWNYTTENVRPRGNGGELMSLPEPENAFRRDYKRQVVEEAAGVLEHQASSDAMDLAAKVDVLPLALEMANSIKARNRAERSLAHQAVAMHSLAMKFAARAVAEADRAETHMGSGQVSFRQIASIESCRNANASARAMTAFNDAMLTLQRLRTGGKQKVVVVYQHVAVADGGKAVVAGNLKTRGRGSRHQGAKQK